jgi:hypothetical protein
MKNWDLSEDCTLKVYILVFYQLLADDETDLAKNLMVSAQPLIGLRDSDPQFYLQLSEMDSVRPNKLVDQRELVAEMVVQELEEVFCNSKKRFQITDSWN